MLDIKYIREFSDIVKENMQKKGRKDVSVVDEVLKIDKSYRSLLQEEQDVRASRNTISKQINEAKKKGEDIKPRLAQVQENPQKVKELTAKRESVYAELITKQKTIPNIMHKDVPIGTSDADNVEVERIGDIPTFSFAHKPHQQIAVDLGMADFESSAKTSGNGFYYIQGDLAL
ncbi:MAG: serine--tRNA ligase, partial [Candidatus Woesearchaeota archaeon]